MSIWNDSDRSLDHLIRNSDRTLNVLVAVFLGALMLVLTAYYYGQLHPRVPMHSAAFEQSAPAPTP
jgi:hypothetical protein